jgi:hypothetical protein
VTASTKPARTGKADHERNARIRAWAADNGIWLPHLGRIPQAVHHAYKQAHHAKGGQQ